MNSRGFLYSFIAHLVIVLFMLVQIIFFPSGALDISQAIRVDMVDLPDKITSQPIPEEIKKEITKEPQKELPEKEEKSKKEEKPETKAKALPDKKSKADDDAVNLNKAKSKQREALNKLKTASALEKLKKELEKEKATEQTSPQPTYKGRVLSAGTALTGLDKMQSDSYLSQLDSRIKAHWSLPQWLIGKALRTRVQIKFDEGGNIIYKRIVQSSGNPTYDEYCLLAIDKASPFPRVPEKFTVVYKVDGVVIGFPD